MSGQLLEQTKDIKIISTVIQSDNYSKPDLSPCLCIIIRMSCISREGIEMSLCSTGHALF